MDKHVAAIKDWVKDRPYLKEIAQLAEITAAVTGDHEDESGGAEFDAGQIAGALGKGIPFLKTAAINGAAVKRAAALFIELSGALSGSSLPDKIRDHNRQIQSVLADGGAEEQAAGIITGVLESDSVKGSDLGLDEGSEALVLFLAWTALAGALEPLKQQLAELLKETRWVKGYCPLCGRLPAMAQLVRTEKGRERDLLCGSCGMRWRYKRMGCPYCETDEPASLEIIGLDDEPDLRIDTCAKCNCYLKTYTGEGSEETALAGWSTLHLDMIAKKRGFKRIDYRMYGV